MRKPKDIKIGNYTLEEILERHQHWLNRDCEKWGYMRANLSDADLSYANLSGASLHGAYLHDADLSDANLSYANLSGAYLHDADLYGANLSGTYLHGADLRCANLSGANLIGADLSFNDRLRKGIKLSEPIIGWKKCKNGVLVKLEIPRGAIVFSINNKKCRTDKAKVLEIIGADRAYSTYNRYFSYYVGDVIEIFDFNCEYNVECAKGIHFFRTKEEAENY